jgi:hypothetical protein
MVLLHPWLHAQQKHALIIAIGKYDLERTNWGPLNSANDVPVIKAVLEKQNFSPDHIKLLQDEAASRAGIEKALTDLVQSVQLNDIVVIHISSHGVQLEDNNGDETDGLDEAIVPYGAIYPKDLADLSKYADGYFRDDDFGKYMEALRSKTGPKGNVIVFLDACHSSTATRSSEAVRGGKAALVSPGFSAKTAVTKMPESILMEQASTGLNLAPYVVIAAARSEELNREVRNDDNVKMGSLTYALSKAFEQLKPGTTYRTLYADVLSVMNDEVPNQSPSIEGNQIDQQLFAGKLIAQDPFVEILTLNGTTLVVKGGKLWGLDVGAKVALHKSGTVKPDATSLLANGVVTEANTFTATVQLENDGGIMKESEGWVFLTTPVFQSLPLVLSIAGSQEANGFSTSQAQALMAGLASLPAVSFQGKAELWLTHGPTTDSIIIASNGLMFGTFTTPDILQKQLKSYIQYKFLKGLEVKDTAYDVAVRLLPIINGKTDSSRNHAKLVQGLLELEVGDQYYIEAHNRSSQPLYINILDLQPDGLINPVLPISSGPKPIAKSELKLEPGQVRIFPIIMQIGPPLGMETYKVFVAKEEIDMESIAINNGSRTRSNLTALQELVHASFVAAAKGDLTVQNKVPEGSVYSIVFRIKEKK